MPQASLLGILFGGDRGAGGHLAPPRRLVPVKELRLLLRGGRAGRLLLLRRRLLPLQEKLNLLKKSINT